MKKVLVPLLMSVLAAASFAAETALPETPGSAAAQAYAETLRNARIAQSGRTAAFDVPAHVDAETPGHAGAQAAAEATHLRKTHGSINVSADQRLEFDHPNH